MYIHEKYTLFEKCPKCNKRSFWWDTDSGGPNIPRTRHYNCHSCGFDTTAILWAITTHKQNLVCTDHKYKLGNQFFINEW